MPNQSISAPSPASSIPPSPPAHIASPATHKLWDAILKKADSVVVKGLTVLKPVALKAPAPADGAARAFPTEEMEPPLPALPPASGFILSGQVIAFGVQNLTGKVRSFHGPPPVGLGNTGSKKPSYQHIALDNSIGLFDLFPFVAGSSLKNLQLNKPVITAQSHQLDPTKSAGWHVGARVTIGKEHGAIYNFLNKVLSLSDAALSFPVHIPLGAEWTWKEIPTTTTSVCVEGKIPIDQKAKPAGVKLFNGVVLTQIDVQLQGDNSSGKLAYSFTVSGELNLVTPGSTTPLAMSYTISEAGGKAKLEAKTGSTWSNAFGIGIDLETVSLTAEFDLSGPLKSLDLKLSAAFSAGNASGTFSGDYSTTGIWSLIAHVDHFDIKAVSDVFKHITGETLDPPEKTDVVLGSADIEISKSAGADGASLAITLEDLQFDKYHAPKASLTISSSGIVIEGNIADVAFNDVTLKGASMKASFEMSKSSKNSSSKNSDVMLQGVLIFDPCPALAISAAVHLYKGEEGLEWTIYGAFPEGKALALVDLVPSLKATPFGTLALGDVLFVAASKDDPEVSDLNPQKYTVGAGVQICASLEEISGVQQLLRGKPPALTLSAKWKKPSQGSEASSGFELDVCLPSETSIHLGRGITTDPIELSLETSRPFSLNISAGVKVPVAKSPAPLDFKMILGLIAGVGGQLPTVSFSGDMDGFWVDPFGISDQVKIGNLLMSLNIILPEFFLTGVPSGFSLAGTIGVGETTISTAVDVSENPEQELIRGSVHKMSITDAEEFIHTFTGLKLPAIPNFLVITDAEAFLSTGVALGPTDYPAGFSFKAEVIFCGANLNASASFLDKTLKIGGDVSGLKVGPLTVTGHDSPTASLDLEFGESIQHVSIDGKIDFLGIDVALLLHLDLKPTPTFSFDFILQFTSLLTFQVDATMAGGTEIHSFSDLSHLDFVLDATFEQHLLDYVRDQTLAQLEKAKAAVKGDISAAQGAITDAEKKYQDDIAGAQKAVDAANAAWQAHAKKIHDSSQTVIDTYNAKAKQLQAELDAERTKFNLTMKNAEGALQSANSERASKLQAAQADVTKAKGTWDHSVGAAEADLQKKQVLLNQKFGNAEKDITDAENKVNSIQGDINKIQGTIHDYENAHWYEVWKKAAIPALEVSIGGLKASQLVADGVLETCKAIVKGGDYLTAKGAIPLAEHAVEEAGKVGDAAFRAAQDALVAVDKVTQKLVDDAQKALSVVQSAGDAACKGAEATLNQFIATGRAILDAAQKAIDELAQCAEWLVYQAATAALALANHATHSLDIAKGALEVAQAGAVGVMDIAEDAVKVATGTLNITEIKLHGSLQGILHKGESFTATVTLSVMGGKPETLPPLNLNLKSTHDFVVDIFKGFCNHSAVQSPKAVAAAPAHPSAPA